MERLLTVTADFRDTLSKKETRIPHKMVQSFLSQLLDLVKVVKTDSSSSEDIIVEELFSDMAILENMLTDPDGIRFLINFIKMIEMFFVRRKKLLEEFQFQQSVFVAQVDALHTMVNTINSESSSIECRSEESCEEKQEETHEETHATCGSSQPVSVQPTMTFEDVLTSPNYIVHYVGCHHQLPVAAIVVLWRDAYLGPQIIHNSLPVFFYRHVDSHFLDSWESLSPSIDVYSADLMRESRRIAEIINIHEKNLFKAHSNLAAIRPCIVNGSVLIEFVVYCKGFVPIGDNSALPRDLDGVPTRVKSGFVEFCGRKELAGCRPLLPGSGIGVGDDAKLKLIDGEQFNEPALGTLGGFYKRNGILYGVTCAHCIRSASKELHEKGAPVYQPSAMGLIACALYSFDQSGEFDKLRRCRGEFTAMKHVMDNLRDNTNGAVSAAVGDNDACGSVYGAVLGPLHNNGHMVDVAVVKLKDDIEVALHCTPTMAYPASPEMIVSDDQQTFLSADSFPSSDFYVYGRGAKSLSTMEALINPLMSGGVIRPIQSEGVNGLTFHCIFAQCANSFEPGDSGMWVWTNDGQLLGMGMARECCDNKKYCCILEMSDVVAGLEQIFNE